MELTPPPGVATAASPPPPPPGVAAAASSPPPPPGVAAAASSPPPGAASVLLEEHDGQGRNKDHGRTEKKQQYEQIYKLPESEMPQRKDGQKEVVYGQEVADAVVRYFVVRSANDDAPDDKELGRANKAKGVETLRKNRGIPKKADIIRMNLLVEVLAQNGVLNNGPQLIDNAMAKIHDQPRRRPRVGGIQVAGYYAVRLRDPNETVVRQQLQEGKVSPSRIAMEGFAAGDLHRGWSLLRRIVFSDIGDEEEQYIHTACFVFDWHDDVFHLQELLERPGIRNAGFLRSARISGFEAVIPAAASAVLGSYLFSSARLSLHRARL